MGNPTAQPFISTFHNVNFRFCSHKLLNVIYIQVTFVLKNILNRQTVGKQQESHCHTLLIRCIGVRLQFFQNISVTVYQILFFFQTAYKFTSCKAVIITYNIHCIIAVLNNCILYFKAYNSVNTSAAAVILYDIFFTRTNKAILPLLNLPYAAACRSLCLIHTLCECHNHLIK